MKTVLLYQMHELEWNGKFSAQHKGRIRCHIENGPSSQSDTTSMEQPTTVAKPETLQDQIEKAVQDQQVLRLCREKRQPR